MRSKDKRKIATPKNTKGAEETIFLSRKEEIYQFFIENSSSIMLLIMQNLQEVMRLIYHK